VKYAASVPEITTLFIGTGSSSTSEKVPKDDPDEFSGTVRAERLISVGLSATSLTEA
jgi:hypothetical protein